MCQEYWVSLFYVAGSERKREKKIIKHAFFGVTPKIRENGFMTTILKFRRMWDIESLTFLFKLAETRPALKISTACKKII